MLSDKPRLASLLLAVNSRRVGLLHQRLNPVSFIFNDATRSTNINTIMSRQQQKTKTCQYCAYSVIQKHAPCDIFK